MKKVSKIFVAVLCVCLSIVTLTACSKYNALLKAFEKEGYKEVTTYDDKDSEKGKKDIEEKDSAAKLHLLVAENNITHVLIVEFKSTKKMVEYYKDSETVKGFVKDVKDNEDVQAMYNALVDAGYANGNCLVIPISVLKINEITNIVKSVK